MKIIMRTLRLMGLICLVALTFVGMVITGPPPPPVKRKNTIEAIAEDDDEEQDERTYYVRAKL